MVNKITDVTSCDGTFDFEFEFFKNYSIPNVVVSSYALRTSNNYHLIGIACDIDKDNNDANIKLMHPHYPSWSYH